MQIFRVNDIISINTDTYTTIGRVTDVTDSSVAIFRDPEDVWYDVEENHIVKIGEVS